MTSITIKGGHGFIKPCKHCLTNHMQLLKLLLVILCEQAASLVNVSFYRKGNVAQASIIL